MLGDHHDHYCFWCGKELEQDNLDRDFCGCRLDTSATIGEKVETERRASPAVESEEATLDDVSRAEGEKPSDVLLEFTNEKFWDRLMRSNRPVKGLH